MNGSKNIIPHINNNFLDIYFKEIRKNLLPNYLLNNFRNKNNKINK